MSRHRVPTLLIALLPALPAVVGLWWWAVSTWRASEVPNGGRTMPSGALGPVAVAAIASVVWVAGTAALHARRERPLKTLANLLAALRVGDFSLRARADATRPSADDALALALHEANLLADTLRAERLGALEGAALLRRVLTEVDVAIFALDAGGRLRLVNRAGERLLARPADAAVGEDAAALGLRELLATPADAPPRVRALAFPGGAGRWEVRTGAFRQGGRPHQLFVVTDLREALRAEERQAWQRLVRVLSHEINNSLTPIKTIAGSLRRRLVRAAAAGARGASGGLTPEGVPNGMPDSLPNSLPDSLPNAMPDDAPGSMPDVVPNGALGGDAIDRDALARGLGTIGERADALARFIGAYARLTRLPPPSRQPLDVAAWVRRVATLEVRLPVCVADGPAVCLTADPDQLDQLLINLVRNAADAAIERGGGVAVTWDLAAPATLRVVVDDDGPGLAATANLFVPFYSTKPEGSGIGLALAQQIAEAHGGAVTLANRADGAGCRATVTLPAG